MNESTEARNGFQLEPDAPRRGGNALSRIARDPVSRRRFFTLAGGSGAAAAFLAACGDDDTTTSATTTPPSTTGGDTGTEQFGKGDLGILNYALTLEYLETAFYQDVVRSGLFKGSSLETIRTFGNQEAEHVAALTAAVKKSGGKPAPKPKTNSRRQRRLGADVGSDRGEPRRRCLPRPSGEHPESGGARLGACDSHR